MSSTAQLALSLALRFNDMGSSAARSALDGVQRALDGVRQKGGGAAEAAGRIGDKMWQAGRGARDASAAAAAAADNFGRIGQNRADEGLRRIRQEADAATQALNKTRQAAERAAGPLRGPDGRFLPGGGSGAGVGGGAGFGALAAIKNLGSLGAGYMAGKSVLQGPVAQTMSYERQLANLANTGAPDGSIAQRQALMKEMDAGVMAAVRVGGGSRESALATLDKMVASGAYEDTSAALKDLPALVKAGTASGADTAELADIAIKARQTMGITDLNGVLAKAMRSGQLGGFELKDMAKWLPKQMALAGRAGLYGENGLISILAANQAAVVTAGSKDEAGNNLVNLLAKINSQDTAGDAKKLGIDLTGSLAAARKKGVNGLDAFINLVEQIVAKDSKYQEIAKKAKTAKGDEQKSMYEDMAGIMKGSAIGKIIQDQQALLALIGVMQQRHAKDGNTQEIRDKTGAATEQNTTDPAHALIASLPSYKAEMLAAEKANAMQQAMNNVNPALGKMADWLSGMARDYPTFTASAWAATTALTALSAASSASALIKMLTGGGNLGLGALATEAGGAATALKILGGGVLALGVGFGLGSIIDQAIDGTEIKDNIGKGIAQFLAMFGNKEAFAALIERQLEAADKLKDAARSLGEAKPVVALDMAQFDRDLQAYQNSDARRR